MDAVALIFQTVALLLMVGGVTAAITGWILEAGRRVRPGIGDSIRWAGILGLVVGLPMFLSFAFQAAWRCSHSRLQSAAI